MALSCGIVGLPNVGKSSLFNILTKTQLAEAANYPFCTIEPNSAVVAIKDERLDVAAKIAGSQKIIYSQIEIFDIAGLVKGASSGEGLGNKFLSHIREVDAIIHVIRYFKDDDISHVHDSINPSFDKEIIELELITADIDSIDLRVPKLEKRKTDKEAQIELEYLKKMKEILVQGRLASEFVASSEDEKKIISKLQLLTTKPMIYVVNVGEEEFLDNSYQKNIVGDCVAFPIKFESDFIDMTEEERAELMESYGAATDNIQKLLKKCFDTLGLHSFFTVGPKEAHSWTIPKKCTAPQAAGVIHGDFEKGFIRAETISYEDYVSCNGEKGAKDIGRCRTEGKEYIVKDADVMHFLFNV